MKKFFLVVLGVIVTTQVFGDSPLPQNQSINEKKIDLLFGNHCMIPGCTNSKTPDCPDDKPLYSFGDKQCYSCDTTETIFNKAGCNKCSNRKNVRLGLGVDWDMFCVLKQAPNNEFVFDEYYGWIKKCSEDKPLYVNGECISCDSYTRQVTAKELPGCDKCKNFVKHDKRCFLCPDDAPLILEQLSGGHMIRQCAPCDSKDIAIAGCEKCENRISVHGRCFLKCSEDKPLLTIKGRCITCEEKSKLISGQEWVIFGQEKCPTLLNNTSDADIKTDTIKKQKEKLSCPDDKPLNVGGKCADCDTNKVAFKTGCEKCPNRRLVGSFCFKNRI